MRMHMMRLVAAVIICCLQTSWSAEVGRRAADIFESYRESEGNIQFYGKVIDQSGASVEGAIVRISMPIQEAIDGPLIARSQSILTDSNGCFEISAGALKMHELKGHDLIIEGIRRNGYESEVITSETRGYSYSLSNSKRFIPNSLNPIIYHMRKKGRCAFLLEEPYWTYHIPLPTSNVTSGYDFIQKRSIQNVDKSSNNDGSLICDINVNVESNTNSALWRITIFPGNANGGIQVSDKLLYEAPEQGYLAESHISWTNLGRVKTQYLYLKSRDPAIYTRVEIDYVNAGNDAFLLDGKSVTNPYGDRNLEPAVGLPYEVTKRLTDEVKDAFRQNTRPVRPDLDGLKLKTSGGAEMPP